MKAKLYWADGRISYKTFDIRHDAHALVIVMGLDGLKHAFRATREFEDGAEVYREEPTDA